MVKPLLVLVVALMLGTGCTLMPRSSPAKLLPTVPTHELLLDGEGFPRRWQVDPCEPDCGRAHRDAHSMQSFGIPGVAGHALQDVFRLDSVDAARDKFRTYREVHFRKHDGPRVPSTEFLPPANIQYHPTLADDYYLGCGVDVAPACLAIVRYQNYFVSFFFNVNEGEADGVVIPGEGLNIGEIEPILRALDQRVTSRLRISGTARD